MNRLNIGETILHLRKEKNITQEQLASMVGVTAGAVSKWETGNSVPDITILSPLTRALNTSLDILLSFQRELSETEAGSIKQELTEVFLHKGYKAGEAKCEEYLKNYPNSIPLKFAAASLTQMYLMMSEDHSEEFVKTKMKDSLVMFQQIAKSREPKYAPAAFFSIANIQMILENYEESEKAIKELPQAPIDPMILYPTLYLKQGKTSEAMNLCSRMLLQYLNQSYLALTTMANISKAQKKYDKSVFYLDAVNKMQNIFKMGLNSAAHNYCKLYMETNNREEAAKWFKTYVEGLLSAEYDYHNNPYFESVELEVNPEGQKIIRKKLLQSLIDEDDFKVLAGISEYEDAIKKLKAAAD